MNLPASIDINADVGEGLKVDAELIPLLSSCNIACGGHAGDEASMVEAISYAKGHQVQIGAHPSYPDRERFGRFEMDISPSELFESVERQIKGLQSICNSLGAELSYVKPHGALYHSLNNSYLLGLEFAELIKSEFSGLKVLGFPNMGLSDACNDIGIAFIKEGFADRAYNKMGTLKSRGESGAIIDDLGFMKDQVLKELIPTGIESLCFHGDHQHTLSLVPAIKELLIQQEITVRSF